MAKFVKGFKTFQDLENLFGNTGYNGPRRQYRYNNIVDLEKLFNKNRGTKLPPKYFGKPLDPIDERSIPPFLSQFYKYIKENGLKSPNLFRKEGNKELVDEVIEIMDDAEEEDLEMEEIIEALEEDEKSVFYSLAMMIKLYFRAMPEPALTFPLYDQWVECGNILLEEKSGKINIKSKIKKLVEKLDKTTLKLLRDFFEFLMEVASQSEVNLMTTQNLSLEFSLDLLRPKVLDFTTFKDAEPICKLIQFLIENHVELFQLK